jgi:hypothetical protein
MLRGSNRRFVTVLSRRGKRFVVLAAYGYPPSPAGYRQFSARVLAQDSHWSVRRSKKLDATISVDLLCLFQIQLGKWDLPPDQSHILKYIPEVLRSNITDQLA